MKITWDKKLLNYNIYKTNEKNFYEDEFSLNHYFCHILKKWVVVVRVWLKDMRSSMQGSCLIIRIEDKTTK